MAVLSDTHLRGDVERLPAAAVAEIERADVVLHAGDVLDAGALEGLRDLAGARPLHVVLGNNDRELVGLLPDRLEVELAGRRRGMVHDTGARAGTGGADAALVPDGRRRGVRPQPRAVAPPRAPPASCLFNPGSAVQRRRQPHHTVGVLELGEGRVIGHRIVVVDPPT